MSRKCVYEWFKRFREGKETTEDEPRSGRLSTGRTPEMIEEERQMLVQDRRLTLKLPLDGQYFCTIFEVAQWYWTFVGTIERLCNVIDSIKTFLNILRNLEILCRLWVVLHNILSVLLFRFSFLCLPIDYENKMWRNSVCYWIYRTV